MNRVQYRVPDHQRRKKTVVAKLASDDSSLRTLTYFNIRLHHDMHSIDPCKKVQLILSTTLCPQA